MIFLCVLSKGDLNCLTNSRLAAECSIDSISTFIDSLIDVDDDNNVDDDSNVDDDDNVDISLN